MTAQSVDQMRYLMALLGPNELAGLALPLTDAEHTAIAPTADGGPGPIERLILQAIGADCQVADPEAYAILVDDNLRAAYLNAAAR